MKAALPLGLGLFALLACGVSNDRNNNDSMRFGTTKQGIAGGSTTTSYPFAVGINIGNQAVCSGALIAKNLVMTARHCVSTLDTGEAITPQSVFDANYTAQSFGVTTNPVIGNGGYHGVSQVLYPNSNTAMGNDIALLVLSSNISAGEATPVTPVVQHAAFNTARYSLTFTAIGYGLTGVGTNDSGTRRIRQNIDILCMDGTKTPGSCAGAVDNNGQRVVVASEFLTGAGLCKGDSGSSAYPDKTFAGSPTYTYGVLSRGPATSCDNAIYTRTDSHKSFLVNGAITAASAGGYTAPAWTNAEAQDPEDAPYTGPPPKDAGKDTGKSDASSASKGEFGASCTDDSECTSELCRPNGDESTCTQSCDDENACPDGYACTSGVCGKPAAPTGPADAGSSKKNPTTTSQETTTSSCSMDPTKPTPWRGGVALGAFSMLAMLTFVRRRK